MGLSKCRRKARVRLIPSPMGCCEGRLVRKAGLLQLCPNQSPASRGERAVVLIKVERKIGSHFHHVAFLEQSARGGLSPATAIALNDAICWTKADLAQHVGRGRIVQKMSCLQPGEVHRDRTRVV